MKKYFFGVLALFIASFLLFEFLLDGLPYGNIFLFFFMTPGAILIGCILVDGGHSLRHLRRRPDFDERLAMGRLVLREGRMSPAPRPRLRELSRRANRPVGPVAMRRLARTQPPVRPTSRLRAILLGVILAISSVSLGALVTGGVVTPLLLVSSILFFLVLLGSARAWAAVRRPWSGSPYSRGIGAARTFRSAGETPDFRVTKDFPGLYRTAGF